jgi:hypothetical protein
MESATGRHGRVCAWLAACATAGVHACADSPHEGSGAGTGAVAGSGLAGAAGSGASPDAGGAAGQGASAGKGGGAGAGGHAGIDGRAEAGAGGGADAGADAGEASGDAAATLALETITDLHRFVPGKMFGGWGPHLGHLVRARASTTAGHALWFVDDLCSQSGGAPGACDVSHDHTLGYFERTASGWQARSQVTLPGVVQQNTATIGSSGGDMLLSYGVDIASGLLRECRYAPVSGPAGCVELPFKLASGSNYIGAAISPSGAKVVWWTVVVDGGGGSFHYVVDYGGGWNGPRSGGAGGYNDASYVNIAFGAGSQAGRFAMHAQFVSGWAPDWGFVGGVGSGDLATTDAVSWSTPFAVADGVQSTNDVWIDPATGDTHLVGRTEGGEAVYYHRPAGGSWSKQQFALPSTYRARLLFTGGRLALVYGPNAGGLEMRAAGPADRPAGKPIAWAALAPAAIGLPPGFGPVQAIYPESPAYQTLAADGVHVVLVGQAQQNVALHVGIDP